MTHRFTQWGPLAVGVSSLALCLPQARAAENNTPTDAAAPGDRGVTDTSNASAAAGDSANSREVTSPPTTNADAAANGQEAGAAMAAPDNPVADKQVGATPANATDSGETATVTADGPAGEVQRAVPSVPAAPEPPSNTSFDLRVPVASATSLGSATTQDSLRVSTSPAGFAKTRTPVWGIDMDIGLPDGIMAGAVARPWPYGRVQVSAGTNGVSMGLRGGVVLRMPNLISPALSVEAGHYFDGNASKLANALGAHDSPLAKSVGYQFVNLHVGLEVGSRRSSFFIHGGMSYVHSVLRHANDAMTANGSADTNTFVSVQSDPQVVLWLPSVKLGLVLYLA